MSETEHKRISVKLFTFEDASGDKLCVSVPEVLDPRYGMYVWPCAVVLAQFVWMRRQEVLGKTVLELGAGVSLPGVLAARCGAHVILTDSGELPRCLHNCHRSCHLNQLQHVTTLPLTWGQVSPELLQLPTINIILGSDVFYQPEDFENVLVTVSFLLRRNPRAQFWTTYQKRSAEWSIEALLHKWNLSCTDIPLDHFQANTEHLAGSCLPGSHSIQMMSISVKPGKEG